MRKSIATVSLSGTLDEKLAAVARAGFDGVEIFENDLINSPARPAEVRRWAHDLGLTVDLYQPFRDFEATPEARFRRNLDRAERKLDVMAQLGAATLLVCSSVSDSAVDDDAAVASQLRALADRAAERGIRIAYEALAWGRYVHDYRRAAAIVMAADHPHLGVCLDSFHILSRGDDPAEIAGIPGEKIFYLQLADAPRLVMDVVQWSRHYRCFPGQGGFDLASFVELVVAAGYRGPLSLEVFNDTFRQADASRTAVDAMRSLLWLEESLRGRLVATERGSTTMESGNATQRGDISMESESTRSDGQSRAGTQRGCTTTESDNTRSADRDRAGSDGRSPAAAPDRRSRALARTELFDPPAAPALGGFEFVELAVGRGTTAATEQLLGQLGFARAGRHRTKPVTLWQQGTVRVLLNAVGSNAAGGNAVGSDATGRAGRAGSDAVGGEDATGGGGSGVGGGDRAGGGARADATAEVAALGLRTSDPDQSANRAEALRAPVVPRRRGPGEVDLPAVRATDGTAVLFCGDDRWLEDFQLDGPQGESGVPGADDAAAAPRDDRGDRVDGPDPVGRAAAAPRDDRGDRVDTPDPVDGPDPVGRAAAGPRDEPGRAVGGDAAAGSASRAGPRLTRIDHVNLSVPFDQFDEAILFLRSVLGLQPRENLELADPYGLVRSRALADRGETVRVALNVLQLRGRVATGDRAGSGADARVGAAERGLQHVAFGCDDIFAAARAVRAAGLRSLPVSDNYYDDLAARFDLPDERLAALRELGILYDRSAAGEYFHVYTEMLGHHLFFEIVQRAGDDTGFGASNAPVRMAAQRAAARR